ncbi:MAG: hypothetical protein JO362_21470 [Streptomycetaceae bacterium]|nr:hypothetical protein [Streptomycetaceae bacterium]
MRARITLTATVLVGVATLLLSACGNDAKPSDTIKGAQTGPAPSPSASVADAAHRPKITLPADVHDVFEDTSTGDPTKDAIWSDAAQRVMALDEAKAEGNPRLPALLYYSAPLAQASAYQSVERDVQHGYSITGTDRYYAPDITVRNDTATLNYCSDESKWFTKVRKTGKVMTTPVDKNSYVWHITGLKQNAAGVWQTAFVNTQRGATQCES